MESYKTTIQQLKKKLTTLNGELSDTYQNLGATLLADNHAISAIKQSDWQSFRERRANCSNEIIKIKEAIDRLDELRKFSGQVVKRKKIQEKKIKHAKKDFTCALYEQYKNGAFAPFEIIADDLGSLKIELDQSELALQDLKEANEKASFLKKMTALSKEQSLKLKITRAKHAINSLIIKRQDDILIELSKYPMASMGFSDQVQQMYEKLGQVVDGFSESESKELEYQNEKEVIEKTLHDLSAGTNSATQIQELTIEASNLDNKIDAIEKSSGIDFANLFYDIAGNKQNAETVPELKYAEVLASIENKRHCVVRCQLQIDVAHIRMEVNDQEHIIQTANTSIEHYNKKIEEYTQMIKTAEQMIDNAIFEKENLLERLAELEEKLQ